ncbi:methyl-accepting chemotaxis protein [Phaeobacter sp. B1627]|uniref:methyl-accepting chemotaxis protein n=1 Tax=Phaeobacter sp. B1627 TaxID=2583809 RepID=UPI00111947A9|nr:methyl-accepting chemotaxis protein [Phaeobacter sp. B1627]TNJ47807.1 HAMP domain-containing protein [Phaeobacter sp. B1627]
MPAAFYGLSIRFYAIVALALITASSLTVYMLNSATTQAYKQRDEEMHKIADTSLSLLDDLNARVEAGELTLAAAQAEGRRLLEVIRFSGSGYMFAFELDGTMRAHPFKPEWIGENQIDVEDVTGIKIFREFLNGITETGFSRITYYFDNPKTEAIEPKIGYALYHEPWGWVVGTGSYVDDIEDALGTLRLAAAIGLGLGVVLMLLASTLIIHNTLPPLNALQARMTRMSEGDLDSEVPSLKDRSEVGRMALAVANFRDGLQLQAAMEQEARVKDEERQRVVAILSQRLADFAGGDLTVRVDDDMPEEFRQISEDFNATVTEIAGLMRRLISGVGQIERESSALDEASRELGMRTETQAASLEQTSAALTELSASVKTSADESHAASERVKQASEHTEHGAQVVKRTIAAMMEIEESSQKISSITTLIDDIAFQTSLLALNAGVEAARAGEAGRGFAVVAGEVRALAGKSSDAAREIAELITNASREVETGVALARDSGTALDEINGHIAAISDTVTALAEAAREQSTGLSEITSAADQLDQVTQQNAAMFEETSATTQRLRNEAGVLARNARQFQLDSGDTGTTRRAS